MRKRQPGKLRRVEMHNAFFMTFVMAMLIAVVVVIVVPGTIATVLVMVLMLCHGISVL
ncbi:MAG: hypothetical protein ACE5EO_12880 [Candidatus Krumholzibacteriia bacterium]